jgi:hypothetical protein
VLADHAAKMTTGSRWLWAARFHHVQVGLGQLAGWSKNVSNAGRQR